MELKEAKIYVYDRLSNPLFKGKNKSVARESNARQILLMQAMKVTQDPEKLRQMIGVKRVADVYKTLDKMAMRREYHKALENAGVSFDFLVAGLAAEATNGEKSRDRIQALSILLKSVGMDKYDAEEGSSSGGTWEQELIKTLEAEKQDKKSATAALPSADLANLDTDYVINTPVIPASARAKRDEENAAFGSIYE